MKNLLLAGIGIALLVLVILYAIVAPRSIVQAPSHSVNITTTP